MLCMTIPVIGSGFTALSLIAEGRALAEGWAILTISCSS